MLTQFYDGQLRGLSIEAPQFVLLTTIELVGACSQADLGERHALDKTTVSRNIRLLEAKGWIASCRVKDGRKRQLSLTIAGRRLLAEAKPVWNETQSQLMSEMSPAEWNAAFCAFQSLMRALQGLRSKRERGIHKVQ